MATAIAAGAGTTAAGAVAGGVHGKRKILQNAKMMIHQPHGQVGGQVSDIEIQANQIIETRELLNQILADHTGQTIERIAKDTARDRYLSAVQSKEYGLVDEVVAIKRDKKKPKPVEAKIE